MRTDARHVRGRHAVAGGRRVLDGRILVDDRAGRDHLRLERDALVLGERRLHDHAATAVLTDRSFGGARPHPRRPDRAMPVSATRSRTASRRSRSPRSRCRASARRRRCPSRRCHRSHRSPVESRVRVTARGLGRGRVRVRVTGRGRRPRRRSAFGSPRLELLAIGRAARDQHDRRDRRTDLGESPADGQRAHPAL